MDATDQSKNKPINIEKNWIHSPSRPIRKPMLMDPRTDPALRHTAPIHQPGPSSLAKVNKEPRSPILLEPWRSSVSLLAESMEAFISTDVVQGRFI